MSAKKEQVEEKAEETKDEKADAKSSGDLPAKLQKILDAISELTVLEVSQLVKGMEEAFGVSAQAAVAMPVAGAAAAGGDAGGAAEEKTSFDVVLKDFGSAKIKVIKVVREITSLSLKDAKSLVEGAPATIKEGVSKEDSEAIKSSIEEVGGVVEIK